MATVKGPLFSLDASGQIASAVVFSKWKGINYVRSHAIPANPQSAAQVALRAMITYLAQNWASVSTANKATWDDYLSGQPMSNINRMIRYDVNRLLINLGMAEAYPYAGAGTAPAAPTTTPTGGVANVSLSIADGANPGDAWIIHTGATGFTPVPKNILAIVPRSATPTVYVHSPLTAATYYYRIRGMAWDATLGTLEAQISGTAT